jgi:hypothetical protein
MRKAPGLCTFSVDKLVRKRGNPGKALDLKTDFPSASE